MSPSGGAGGRLSAPLEATQRRRAKDGPTPAASSRPTTRHRARRARFGVTPARERLRCGVSCRRLPRAPGAALSPGPPAPVRTHNATRPRGCSGGRGCRPRLSGRRSRPWRRARRRLPASGSEAKWRAWKGEGRGRGGRGREWWDLARVGAEGWVSGWGVGGGGFSGCASWSARGGEGGDDGAAAAAGVRAAANAETRLAVGRAAATDGSGEGGAEGPQGTEGSARRFSRCAQPAVLAARGSRLAERRARDAEARARGRHRRGTCSVRPEAGARV